MNSDLPTALSSHSACFICREKNRRLYKVKKADVIHAYVNHRIYIKHHARHCDAHVGENGLIRREEFFIIPTRNLPQSLDTIKMFDMLAANSSGIFEQFKDMRYLDEEHCKKITGWTKDEFTEFSLCISSVENTKNRSKEQLIALYRYWLRTGIDQKSLASLFSKKTKQTQISDYLDQIRTAICKDFVPYYLGANRDRDFFLRFNTVMTHKLHDLNTDDLVIVADGTYCRIEKSSNNDFQYKTFSQQKNQSLFKPFIICCADGYIIDCYGPFAANSNDATIFDYILETDTNLTSILIPQKTLVLLDRGFRDAITNLNKKQLKPRIPTCAQFEINKSKQLSVKQTSNNRLVTKCRFIIEKKIGEIKKHLALDNRRNTEVSRLMIDYRIACAMLNYFHKPCGADGINAEKIGQRLKWKCDHEKINYLVQLLKQSHDSNTKLTDIDDFPRLSVSKMVAKIFYGSYYIKQCKSYLADLTKSGLCFIINQTAFKSTNIKAKDRKDLYKQLENTRVLGMTLVSRHKRSLKDKKKRVDIKDEHNKQFRESYKVFIHYKPNLMSSKAIIAYVCSCKSGLKQAGCCVHVAVFIYYLSYARYREHTLRLPGEYLNSVLVDMTKREPSNLPRRVRNKRHKKADTSSESSDSDDDDMNGEPINANEDVDDTPSAVNEENVDDTPSAVNEENVVDTPSAVNDDKNDKTAIAEIAENVNDTALVDKDKLDSIVLAEKNGITFSEFETHIPKWSAKIMFKGSEVIVKNTCTIDYIIFALWVLHKRHYNFLDDLPVLELTDTIKKVVQNVEELKWDTARQLWIVNIMKYNRKPIRHEISMFGTERDGYVKHLVSLQRYSIRQICECSSQNRTNGEELYFRKTDFGVQLLNYLPAKCYQCQKETFEKIEFNNIPGFLLIQPVTNNITIGEIPETLNIDNSDFRLLCCTLHIRAHFICVFDLNGQKYVVNDLQNKSIILPPLSTLNNRIRKQASNFYSYSVGTTIYYLKK